MDSQEKHAIAARARTLEDRLTAAAESTPTAADTDTDGDAEEWLARWRETVAEGDERAFRTRLELAGLSSPPSEVGIDTGDWPPDEPLPDWLDGLEDLIAALESWSDDDRASTPSWADEHPFGDLLYPLAAHARSRLDSPGPVGDLSAQALADLERWLVTRLSSICAHPLFIEFKSYVAGYDEALAFGEDTDVPPGRREYYDAFVAESHREGLRAFFTEYAVLSKLLVTLVDQWVAVVEEFAARLRADRDRLGARFAGVTLGAVTGLEPLGDVHQRGRLVFAVSFASGTTLAYKPRSVAVEAAFSSLLEWINDTGDLPELRALAHVTRDGYGWAEWVEEQPCDSSEAVERYYHRAGLLLALAYALNFTDGHLENVVAAGEQPVVVDLETLFHPPDIETEHADLDDGLSVATDSVLSTHLLPLFVPAADVRDQNGFASALATVENVDRPVYEAINTDRMELSFARETRIEGRNLPTLDGAPTDPARHADAILEGFEAMYRFLLEQRETLCSPGSPLERFEGAEIRFLYRSTAVYGKLCSLLETPKYLRDGLAFSQRLETLARPFAQGETDTRLWPLYETECASLWRLDVPRFTVAADDTALVHADGPTGIEFDEPPLATTYRTLEGLCEDDLDEQLAYVELAYTPRRFSHPTPPRTGPDTATDLLTDERALETAHDIARRLHEHARVAPDGSLYWGMREHRVSGAYLPKMPDNLYTGRVGIATFLAALAAVSGRDDYREAAGRVLRPTLDELADDRPFEMMKLGGTLGVGSVIYGLATVGDLLEEPRYVDAALAAARTVTPARLEDDNHLGPHRGSSGLIHGLLALYEGTGEETVLERATLAGAYLQAHRTDASGIDMWKLDVDEIDPTSLSSWDVDPRETSRLGVAHGGDAIATALARLAEHTGDERHRETALETIEYGRVGLSRDPCPDLRIQTRAQTTNGWCDGRAGQGLARLDLYRYTGDERLRDEARSVCDALADAPLAPHDHVYAGNCTRIELLLETGRHCDRPASERAARRLAGATVERSHESGRFTVPWGTDRWYNPSFFDGESGIGYTLLRLCEPSLPPVLFWDQTSSRRNTR
ncbi:type 2 lanthipeptide synthetase LanM [Natronobiforma cellulositropha]|uniref:type 2 lanthipeptide synthetase LanM n=1 Tax=Natronobiforma cellulositropha TaxID=1679076 RepID=UPI0021D56D08|nr:type 2 lanthipeptide synthetase LanM [Natronobiforma cellulositropha]